MVEIVYYVATSLDGYIATPDGGVEWLPDPDTANDYGYAEFYAAVDALLMGSQTYEKVLGFGEWAYPGKPCWVLSQRSLTIAQPDVTLTTATPAAIVAELEARHFKRVWLVGGGQLAASFRAQGLITEYIIAIMPTILGTGIPLFAPSPPQETLELVTCQTFSSGVVMLHYRRNVT